MKRPGCAALTAALFGTTTGCGSSGGSDATVVQVSPTAAFNDAPFSLTIGGAGFRPAYQIDTMSGSASNDTAGFTAFLAPPPGSALARVEATGLAWQSMMEIVAQFPAGIPAGSYDVGVHDPRGQDVVKPMAFASLGPDLVAPSITIQQPASGALFGAGADVAVVFFADDGVGAVATLDWMASTAEVTLAGSCPIASAGGPQACRFSFPAPDPPSGIEALFVDAVAVDQAGNRATERLELAIAPAPTVTSVSPRIGAASGGESIDVEGSNFIPPTAGDPGTQILDDEKMISTAFISSTRLIGLSPAHDPGDVPISVSTGNAEAPAGLYTFVAPAIVRLVNPATGPTWGGTPVAIVGDNFRAGGTTIFFGGVPLGCPRFVSASRIEGLAPATPSAQAVAVAVEARDPVVDGTMLQGGFTYYVEDADGGQPPDGGCAGSGP